METKKKQWGTPLTKVQQFTPNEYCAVCIPISQAGLWGPYEETNGVPGVQIGTKTVAVDNDESPFYSYIGKDDVDGQYTDDYDQFTFNADKTYLNTDGYQYVKLTRIPNKQDYVQYLDAYGKGLVIGEGVRSFTVYYTTDGKIFYQQYRPGTSVYTNHS